MSDAVRDTLDRMAELRKAADPGLPPPRTPSTHGHRYLILQEKPCPRYHVDRVSIFSWLVITVTLAYLGAHLLVAAGVGR